MLRRFAHIDWLLMCAPLPIIFFGIVTMTSFGAAVGGSSYVLRQSIFALVTCTIAFGISQIDVRMLKQTRIIMWLFGFFSFLLVALFLVGHISKGAQSWFAVGGVSFEPSDMMKLVVIILLAKYFSRRHVEIRHMKHVAISFMYAFIPFVLVFLQPDFGSAIIILIIWFGVALVSGLSRRHVITLALIGVVAFAGLWFFAFKPYQKDRIRTFVQPMADIHGSGYNVLQSTIAVGSGQIVGRGVGYGTQSRLKFLPEYQTDFIFAAFAEEWGFIGSLFLLACYAILFWRLFVNAYVGATNFETLFIFGFIFYLLSHIVINMGMNMGIMPVTGITLPFMSYGGSHLLTEWAGIGIIQGMRRYRNVTHRDNMRNEFLGL